MIDLDFWAWFFGIALMALARFRPWEIPEPNAIFAFGLGLALVPAIRGFCEIFNRYK